MRVSGLIFLFTFLVCVGYYASWEMFRWSNAPGFVIVVGGSPWSWLWEAANHKVLEGVQPSAEYFVSLVVLCGSFSLNCAIVYLAVAFVFNKVVERSKDRGPPQST